MNVLNLKTMVTIATLLILSTNVFANEHRAVISGFTKHFSKKDRAGYKYNEDNWGIGYEYNTYSKDNP